MKRYYIVPPNQAPHELSDLADMGEYHYIDLDSHAGSTGTGHRVLVLMDDRKQPPATWEELPHLLDAETKVSDAHLEKLRHLGAKSHHGGFALARLLGGFHSRFKP
jgi:hypothetical protein